MQINGNTQIKPGSINLKALSTEIKNTLKDVQTLRGEIGEGIQFFDIQRVYSIDISKAQHDYPIGNDSTRVYTYEEVTGYAGAEPPTEELKSLGEISLVRLYSGNTANAGNFGGAVLVERVEGGWRDASLGENAEAAQLLNSGFPIVIRSRYASTGTLLPEGEYEYRVIDRGYEEIPGGNALGARFNYLEKNVAYCIQAMQEIVDELLSAGSAPVPLLTRIYSPNPATVENDVATFAEFPVQHGGLLTVLLNGIDVSWMFLGDERNQNIGASDKLALHVPEGITVENKDVLTAYYDVLSQ